MYKPLSAEHNPQPRLPEGYGVARIDIKGGGVVEDYTVWAPCRLLTVEEAKTWMLNYHSFNNPYGGGPLSYPSRRRAIQFIWRWYRRYGDDGHAIRGALCATGIPGNLYDGRRVTIAKAAELLGLSKKDIHWIRKHADLKERLESGKISRGLFYNHYTISLPRLEAYLDWHGYGDVYQSMAARQREIGDQRRLPAVIWNIYEH